MTSIQVKGAEELIQRLDTIAGMKRVKASVKQAAVYLKGKIKTYPAVQRRPNLSMRGNSEKAAAMRRGFFYHLKHGNIEVPYYRGKNRKSEKLEQSWTVSTENSGWVGIVGTSVSYAPLVQDRDEQASYHNITGWKTTYGITHLYGNEAVSFVQEALRKEVENE